MSLHYLVPNDRAQWSLFGFQHCIMCPWLSMIDANEGINVESAKATWPWVMYSNWNVRWIELWHDVFFFIELLLCYISQFFGAVSVACFVSFSSNPWHWVYFRYCFLASPSSRSLYHRPCYLLTIRLLTPSMNRPHWWTNPTLLPYVHFLARKSQQFAL